MAKFSRKQLSSIKDQIKKKEEESKPENPELEKKEKKPTLKSIKKKIKKENIYEETKKTFKVSVEVGDLVSYRLYGSNNEVIATVVSITEGPDMRSSYVNLFGKKGHHRVPLKLIRKL